MLVGWVWNVLLTLGTTCFIIILPQAHGLSSFLSGKNYPAVKNGITTTSSSSPPSSLSPSSSSPTLGCHFIGNERHHVMTVTNRRNYLLDQLLFLGGTTLSATLLSVPEVAWASTSSSSSSIKEEDGIATTTTASNNKNMEFATSAGRKGCTTQSDPSKTIVTCTGELLSSPPNLDASTNKNNNNNVGMVMEQQRRLSSIAATENGISTSAIKNPLRYSPPWSYLPETNDPSKAWNSLIDAVQSLEQIHILLYKKQIPICMS